MSLLKFLMFLTFVVWVGGLIFFPVVAQTAFSVLSSRSMAGLVVGHALVVLHWMGMISGCVFLACSMIQERLTQGRFRPLALRNLVMVGMLALTAVSQFGIIPRMNSLRAEIPGEIDSVPADFPARAQFDGLHVWSTRVEEGVLLLGVLAVYLTANAMDDRV